MIMARSVHANWTSWLNQRGLNLSVFAAAAVLVLLLVTQSQITSSQRIAQQNGDVFDDQPLQDARRHIEDHNDEYANRQRELKNFKASSYDLSAVRDLLTQFKAGMDNLSAILATGDVNALWDRDRDLHADVIDPLQETFQVLYDQQRYVDFKRQLKDADRQLKDMNRLLKDVKRRAKGKNVDVSILEQRAGSYQSKLSSLRAAYNALSLSDPEITDRVTDLQSDYDELNDLSQEFHSAFDEINETLNREGQRKDMQRVLKEKQRTQKNMQRQLKQLKRAGEELSSLQAIAGDLGALEAQMKALASATDVDPDEFWALNTEYGELEPQFWELADELNQRMNMTRTLKDKARTLKDMEREYERERSPTEEGTEALEEAQRIYSEMRGIVEARGESEEFWDYERGFDSASRTFWETVHPESGEGDDLEGLGEEITRLRGTLNGLLAAGTVDAEKIKRCLAYLDDGSQELQAAQAGDDDAQDRLKDIGDRFDADCAKLVGEE